MKFPFVSRGRYNDMVEARDHCRRQWELADEWLHIQIAKYDDLVKAMILPPPVPDTPEPTPEPDLPASVRQAISERAAPGTPAFGQLYAAAAELIANDVEVEDVRRRILIGEKAPI